MGREPTWSVRSITGFNREKAKTPEDKKRTAGAVSSGESFALGEGKAKSSIIGIKVFHFDYVKAGIS